MKVRKVVIFYPLKLFFLFFANKNFKSSMLAELNSVFGNKEDIVPEPQISFHTSNVNPTNYRPCEFPRQGLSYQ